MKNDGIYFVFLFNFMLHFFLAHPVEQRIRILSFSQASHMLNEWVQSTHSNMKCSFQITQWAAYELYENVYYALSTNEIGTFKWTEW